MSPRELSWEEFLRLKASAQPFHKLSVVTPSMEPLMPVGTTVVVDPTADYGIHDIIVFWHNGKLIVHILWHVNKSVRHQGQEVLVTRSLNSRGVDASITRENVLGKVVNYELNFWHLVKLYLIQRTRRY